MQEHKRDRHIDTKLGDNLPGFAFRGSSIAEESTMCDEPIQIRPPVVRWATNHPGQTSH